MNKKTFTNFHQPVVFVLIGGFAFLLANGLYLSFMWVGIHMLLSSTLAYVIASTFAFFANRSLTFNSSAKITTYQVTKYAVLYLITLVFNAATNYIVYTVIRGVALDLVIAFLLATILSSVVNYYGLKHFVFSGDRR